ncbi:hypothetical protein IMG5_013190 [Ichthyophthirius multifiliis]|uniref:Uncharacterized protein n=1 Tax=Ichthyophthirius multifiliis TaxID=5932 RepID=G0QK56_ICHMU|nr:hypothetical protein IMG5_013190 [Ichthyophthirius multifiliis]EGR34401.1 hypothetical protein IMG5_013190 [Ichthyophthirius multifiliis]|eukprot:XP_004039705.1 hypothetical protein IMG5_013190 [Ichthyophthirius multifiliis]
MPKEIYYDIKLYEQYIDRKQENNNLKKVYEDYNIDNDEKQKKLERILKSELYDYQLTKAALNQIIEDKDMVEGIKETQNKAAIMQQTYKMGDTQKALEMQKELLPQKKQGQQD